MAQCTTITRRGNQLITLKQWLELANYRITEGERYLWDCYGKDTCLLSSWNGIHDRGGYSTDIVFDTRTQIVYEVAAHDFTNDRAYRMINPKYAKAHDNEASARGVDMNTAWDGVEYTELDVEEDFVEKATAIVNGQDYDTRIAISLQLDSDLEMEIYRNAHRLDMTVNDYIQMALVELIKTQVPELLETVDA